MRALSVWLAAIKGRQNTGDRGIRLRVWHALALWLLLSIMGWHVVGAAMMYLL